VNIFNLVGILEINLLIQRDNLKNEKYPDIKLLTSLSKTNCLCFSVIFCNFSNFIPSLSLQFFTEYFKANSTTCNLSIISECLSITSLSPIFITLNSRIILSIIYAPFRLYRILKHLSLNEIYQLHYDKIKK
jgi:hypothetical protein